MGGRNLRPYRFNPRGVVDALDGGQVAEGGLRAATDLIFDPANPFTLQCRPAAIKQSVFSGIAGANFVSVSYVVGDVCYGMIKSSIVAGYDTPFAYNLSTNALVTVSGTQNNTTLPLSQTTSGTWTPPTMALVGVLLYVTHPGFVGGGSAFFGWFDVTNPAAPVWHAGNTTTNALAGVPTAVGSFNNRAWFSYKNTVTFTDALTTTVTSATQILTIGDAFVITGLAQQPLVTNVQGIIQSLAVFKINAIALITGDDTTGNLAINIISPEAVGCTAPRTVASTPKGLKFMATDGIRLIAQDGTLGEPNTDLQVPFVNALVPSRASAAYSNNIYRITVQNGNENGNPLQEYWFDERRNGWTGPHSFTQDMAVPYLNTFVVFNSSLAPSLWTSSVIQDGSSSYTENGASMVFKWITAPMADDGGLYENSVNLSVIDMEFSNNGDTYTFVASDVNRGVLSIAQIMSPLTGAIWGSITWGAFIWTAISYGLDRYNIPWTTPLVFSRLVIQASGPSSFGFKIGKLTVGYQRLNYIRIQS